MKRFLLGAALCALTAGSAQASALPAPDHVVVVIMENKDFDEIHGDLVNAPYINSLAAGGLLYTNSHAIEHPSQPNYLDLFSGGNQGVNNANATLANPYNLPAKLTYLQSLNLQPGDALYPTLQQVQQYVNLLGANANVGGDAFPKPVNFTTPVSAPFTTSNLAANLIQNGRSFVEYSDGLSKIPGAVDANGNAVISVINNPADPYSVGYAHRHDPAADWMSDTPTGNQLPNTVEQDFSNFGKDGFDNLPDVSFVVPDTIHDMHDGTVPASIKVGDDWLAQYLDPYVEWAKTHNSLLILTADESDLADANGADDGNLITTILTGDPDLFQQGAQDAYINHFDLLRTLQELYGVPPSEWAGASASARGLPFANGQFTAAPEPGGMALLGLGLSGLFGLRRKRK